MGSMVKQRERKGTNIHAGVGARPTLVWGVNVYVWVIVKASEVTYDTAQMCVHGSHP